VKKLGCGFHSCGAGLSIEAKAADVHQAVIAELAQRLKADNARNTERAEMRARRAACVSSCAGFRTPAPTMPTTRSGGRRPKSAKARNRGGGT
jgi:hypothetical protein